MKKKKLEWTRWRRERIIIMCNKRTNGWTNAKSNTLKKINDSFRFDGGKVIHMCIDSRWLRSANEDREIAKPRTSFRCVACKQQELRTTSANSIIPHAMAGCGTRKGFELSSTCKTKVIFHHCSCAIARFFGITIIPNSYYSQCLRAIFGDDPTWERAREKSTAQS